MTAKNKKNGKNTSVLTDTDYTVVANEPSATTNETAEDVTENASKFTIENVDVPKRPGRKGSLDYPIAKLTAGSSQSFLVPATSSEVKAKTASIRAFAYRNNLNVTLRTEEKGIRVWRAPVSSPANSL